MHRSKLLASVLCFASATVVHQNAATQSEPELSKDSISVHPVRRGDMPVRLSGSGEIVSISPAEVVVTVPAGTTPAPQVDQRASVQVTAPAVMIGRIIDLDRATLLDAWKAKIRLDTPFPPDSRVGTKVDALIEVGELKDVMYFERPATARPDTEMSLFVVAPKGELATRKLVRFGRESGALIQIISGLAPGDMVIVTDTSKWTTSDRIRLK